MSHRLLDLPCQKSLLVFSFWILLPFVLHCGGEDCNILNWCRVMKEKTVLGLFELHWVTWCVDIKGVVYFDVIHDLLDLLELAKGEDVYDPVWCIPSSLSLIPDWQWMVITVFTVCISLSREASQKILTALVLPNRTQFLLIIPSMMWNIKDTLFSISFYGPWIRSVAVFDVVAGVGFLSWLSNDLWPSFL